MDGGGDDPFIQQVLQEIQQKIASETARHTERLESERTDIERRIKERNVDISSNLDIIQTCLSTIREAEEANATLAQQNAVDEQRMEEISRIIETAAKERPQQLLSNLKSKLATPAPKASITEISRPQPQPKAAARLAGGSPAQARKREPRADSERSVADSDQTQAPPLAVRRSGRSVKPVEHLLDTYFTEEPQARVKVSESPTFPDKARAKKRAPVERDDASHQSQSPAPRKRAKRESSSMHVALDTPKEELLAEAAGRNPDEISLPSNPTQDPRPKKKVAASSTSDKPVSKPKKTVTPKIESDDEEKVPVQKMAPEPVVGQVYQIEWCRKPWTAVVLPTGDLGEVGMSGNLTDTGFAPPWPGCYRLFKPRNADPYMGFKFDYRDGNTRSHLRKYPIMYLEEEMVVPLDPASKFEPPKYNPGKYSTYDWVRADQLKPFDLDDPESRKLKGFATTKSFMRRLGKIRDVKAESRITITTSTGREAIQGLADIIINDNEDDSDYYEESSGLSDNDDQDGSPGDGEGDGDSSDEEPRTMTRGVRRRGATARSQSRRSNSRPRSAARATKASRRNSEAEKWSGQHAQSQFKPVSDAESDSDLTSVLDEPMSADTLSLKRDSSSVHGNGLMKDGFAPGGPEIGPGDSRKPGIAPNPKPRKSMANPTAGRQPTPVEATTAMSVKPSVAKTLPSSSGGTDALDGLATAAVALAGQNKAVMPSGHGAITHSRQSSRSDYLSAPASPLLPAPSSHKMRMENFLRPGPTPPIDRSDSSSPTKNMAEYGSYQKTHDFGAPIGRRPPDIMTSNSMQGYPVGAPPTPISRESSSSGHARKSSSSFVNRMVN